MRALLLLACCYLLPPTLIAQDVLGDLRDSGQGYAQVKPDRVGAWPWR